MVEFSTIRGWNVSNSTINGGILLKMVDNSTLKAGPIFPPYGSFHHFPLQCSGDKLSNLLKVAKKIAS